MNPTYSDSENNIIKMSGADGRNVTARTFGLGGSRLPVILLHGLQSHSGWFTQSGSFISELGHPVYAIDRSGSGLSDGPKKWKGMKLLSYIDDIDTVAGNAMKGHGTDKVHVLGHCFGALGATAFSCARPEIVRSLVLPTPGLFTKTDMTLTEKFKVVFGVLAGAEMPMRVPLDPELFSEIDEYVEFIKQDKLSLREATTHFYFGVCELRNYIKSKSKELAMPIFMALAGGDPICNNELNTQFFAELGNSENVLREYTGARHILEFSSEKEAFFADLKRWFNDIEGGRSV